MNHVVNLRGCVNKKQTFILCCIGVISFQLPASPLAGEVPEDHIHGQQTCSACHTTEVDMSPLIAREAGCILHGSL